MTDTVQSGAGGPLTVEDIDQIVEAIELFLMNGRPRDADDRELNATWQPYVDKLKALRAEFVERARVDVPAHLEGKWCTFTFRGASVMGAPSYGVDSRRGGFELGTLEWSNQWNAYSFKPHPDARLSGLVIAEIYAMLKELGTKMGRFV